MNYRTFFTLGLGAAFASFSLPAKAAEATAQTAPAAVTAKSPADVAYDALWEMWRQPAPENLTRKDPALWEFQDKKMRAFAAAARDFYAQYPHDPRRFEGIVQSSYTRPWFVKGFKPEFATAPGERNLIVDEDLLAHYYAEQHQYLKAFVVSPETIDRVRGGSYFALLADARGHAAKTGTQIDLAPFRELADQAVETLGDERALVVVTQYVEALRRQSPAEAEAYKAQLEAKPKLAAAFKAAEEKRQVEEAKQAAATKVRAAEIGAIKFTAADGRTVDLSTLRGKVVLVDFWATWCGPCVAELPNVVATYNKYHEKGFEVVGITLENPNFRPTDSEAQQAEKLAAQKKKMLEFTQKNAMPWPQYYDGKWWKNDYAVKFGIQSIPAMFLLDPEGKIAAIDARGPKLEAEIKRLLKL